MYLSVFSALPFIASSTLNASIEADMPPHSLTQTPFGSQMVLAAASNEKVISIFAMKQEESNKKNAPTYMSGEVVPENALPEAYNAPSGITLKGRDGKWIPDLFVDFSFIYYHASEEGLDLAESASFVEANSTVLAPSKSKVLKQSFNYQPGFKVGIGTNICDWTLFGQYTWIRQFNKMSKTPPTPSPNNGIGVWFMDDWFILGIPVEGQSMPATKLQSKWNLDMDIADLTLGRPYYLARNVSISPSFGLRLAWIRQKMNINIDVPPLNTVANQRSKIFSHNSSNSWAVGPRAGLDAYLLLPKGFRFQGDLSGSILYTDYTKVHHAEQVVNADNNPTVINVNNNGR
ncbi:MAG: Lpg1974 family pore-forming outer membrane protein [Chlamydiota bacterium]